MSWKINTHSPYRNLFNSLFNSLLSICISEYGEALGLELETVLEQKTIQSPFLGIYPKNKKNHQSKRCMHTYVHCSTMHNSLDWETTQESNNR